MNLQPGTKQPSILPQPSRGQTLISILFVEDDPTLRTTITYSLVREGFRVDTAADGEAAMAIIVQEFDYDLIVLDLMLPGMDGLAVLRQIRKRSDVPVLILSARNDEQDKIDGLELGADDFISKPFAMREFVARVRASIRRASVAAPHLPSILYRGDLEIELESQRAVVNGRELPLSRKEFGLLSEMAMTPGRVFTRQQLLDTVWGREIFVDERTVDVHMSWLRSKLRAAGADGSSIRTIYGTGYSFELAP